jgi:hypothetical protein
MNASDVLVSVFATVLFTVVFLALYKYLVNPQMVRPAGKGRACPDLWALTPDGLCQPQYATICSSFDPKTSTLETPDAKCNLAHTCGTDWPGYCP